jgi:hypothetical protein
MLVCVLLEKWLQAQCSDAVESIRHPVFLQRLFLPILLFMVLLQKHMENGSKTTTVWLGEF